jgi:hypothetical protein
MGGNPSDNVTNKVASTFKTIIFFTIQFYWDFAKIKTEVLQFCALYLSRWDLTSEFIFCYVSPSQISSQALINVFGNLKSDTTFRY